MPPRTNPLSLAAATFALVLAPHRLDACRPGDANTFCAHADTTGVPGASTPDGELGAAVALGDFDNNGVLDLVVGAPGASSGDGNVTIFYGGGLALSGTAAHLLTPAGTENGGGFGFSLAAGDVNGDGYDDLVVGQPFLDRPDFNGNCIGDLCSDAGKATLFFGGPVGLDLQEQQELDVSGDLTFNVRTGYAVAVGKLTPTNRMSVAVGSPGSPGESGIARPGRVTIFHKPPAFGALTVVAELQIAHPADESGGDDQGSAVAIGQFGAATAPAMAFGSPGAAAGGTNQSGRVEEATFDADGWSTRERLEATDFGNAGNGNGSHFGASLAVGDFDGNGFDDLAIGSPERELDSQNDAGRVYVAFGSSTGLRPDLKVRVLQESSYSGQTIDNGERFGAALAGGDFDGDGFDDLAIGAPGEGSTDTGVVFLAWGGTANGLDPVPSKGVNFSQQFLGGSNGAGDRFGSALAAGDLDRQGSGNGTDEIAIGAPGKTVGGDADAGMVFVTRELDPAWVFGDGFESGLSAVWSATSP